MPAVYGDVRGHRDDEYYHRQMWTRAVDKTKGNQCCCRDEASNGVAQLPGLRGAHPAGLHCRVRHEANRETQQPRGEVWQRRNQTILNKINVNK